MAEILAKFSWAVWGKGLASAIIGGAVGGGMQAYGSGVVGKQTGYMALTGAGLAMGNYFLQSPLLKPKDPK